VGHGDAGFHHLTRRSRGRRAGTGRRPEQLAVAAGIQVGREVDGQGRGLFAVRLSLSALACLDKKWNLSFLFFFFFSNFSFPPFFIYFEF
jgi:hypothetical protein